MATLSQTAAELDIEIEQGATFQKIITIYDDSIQRDLSGYTARMQVRPTFASTTTILDLTEDSGGITINDDDTITIYISATDTAALDFSTARYDFEIEAADETVTRLLYGKVKLMPEVTR
jgi:hypothetical protein